MPVGECGAPRPTLHYGAEVNAWDEQHMRTALLNATMINHIEAARVLLAAGADPNVLNDEGYSPLRYCAQEGFLDMARLLLLCGAIKTIDEWDGPGALTALSFAARGNEYQSWNWHPTRMVPERRRWHRIRLRRSRRFVSSSRCRGAW
jgi:hypothetical protein